MDKINDLIMIISKSSNRYGDKLLDFMEKANISSLYDATEEQLISYITTYIIVNNNKNNEIEMCK